MVAKLYCDDPKRWGKSVGYFLTEAECIECAEIIRSNGHKVEIVTGSSNQEGQIHEFNNSEDLNLLLNMVVLTEGFDSPILKTVFIRPGSKGPTIQMGGRAFRRHPQKPFCNVVQCDQAWWPFTKIASAERKFLMEQGGHWESREVNEKVEQAQRASILAIAKVTISMPESLKKFQGKKNYFAQQKALSE
jgi:superfamily II DNA or RNA helicase